ncbi:dihydrofolate reductase [Priestia megaterium]
MSISLIAAISETNQLGYKNGLLAHLPNDLKYFKKMTEGKIVVMGRNTFESIGHKLPKRTNIILTRDENYQTDEDVYVYNSVKDVLHEYKNYGEGEVDVMIIGGEQVYTEFLPYADTIYLTRIHHTFDNADTFFPKMNMEEWKRVAYEVRYEDADNDYDYTFLTYKRKGESK